MQKENEITPGMAARELIRRDRAAENLLDYAKYIDIPGAPVTEDEDEWCFSPVETGLAAHHVLIMEVMQKVILGEIPRAMFFLPPGSAKSSYGSVVAPTWAMGREPGTKIILTSYGTELAKKHGRKARQIVKSDQFKAIFETTISKDTAAADFWTTESGSEYMSAGVLAGVTGNRACLRGDAKIVTDAGEMEIRELYKNNFMGKVLSFDKIKEELVFRRVKAVARRSSNNFYKVYDNNGNMVESTGDHRFWTTDGYTEARLLTKGDCLLRLVRGGDNKTSVLAEEVKESRSGKVLLQSFLSSISSECKSWQDGAVLPEMWEKVKTWQELLQRCLFGDNKGRTGCGEGNDCPGKDLRSLRCGVSTIQHKIDSSILFNELQEPGALQENVERKQPRVAWWRRLKERTAIWSLQKNEKKSEKSRQEYVCCLPESEKTARPSYRYRLDKSRNGESGYTLQGVPSGISCRGQVEAQGGSVQLVEEVHQKTVVFDLQVEGTECYFANDILVHNCGIIIDDPVKGRADADSETVQNKTWDAYQEDIRTRLVPGGWEMIIQTRWSENDISGKLLPDNYNGETGFIKCKDDREWYVVCIPAIHEDGFPPDPLGRKPGEHLWPEWFTKEHFDGFKSIRRTWNALFQQRPSPDTGTFFQKTWFRRYRVGGYPQRCNKYMTSDHAPAGEDNSDFNCARVWGVDEVSELWLIDGFREKSTLDNFSEKALPLIKKYFPHCWFPEDDNNWKSAAGFIKRQMLKDQIYCRIEPISPHGQDKETKAQAFQGLASMGCVHIPEGPEGDDIIDQYVRFPSGAHDDEVDAAAIIGRALMEAHPAIIKRKKEDPKTPAQRDWDLVTGKKKRSRANYGN